MNKVIILLSLIPAILWIYYFYRQDKYEKEPLKLLLITFFLGCLSVIPALIIELAFQEQINYYLPFGPLRICIGMLMVGFTEELCKLSAVKSYAYKNEEFNEPVDGIVYSVTAALGFAFVENIAYMVSAAKLGGLMGAYTLGAMRAIFSMFGHATFAVIVGSYLGRARFDKDNEGMLITKGIFLASIVHAFYNYTVSINKEGISAFLVLIALVLVWRNLNRVVVDAAVDKSPFKPELEAYVPKKWHWGFINSITVIMIITVVALSTYNFDQPRFYSNQKAPFILRHHNFWGVVPNYDNKSVKLIAPSYKGIAPVAMVYVQATDGSEINTMLVSSMERLKHDRPNLEIISSDNLVISGRDASRIIVRWKQKKKSGGEILMRTHLVVTIRGENCIIYVFEASDESFDEMKEKFDDIMNSVELKGR